MVGYDKHLSDEWIDWVEVANPLGTREREIIPYIRNWITRNKPKALCDIGCGQGSVSLLFDKKTEYIGIDASETLLERAKNLYSATHKQFIIGDAYHLPLAKNSVDAIISLWVWSHLENLIMAATEMFRILRLGGTFLIITANPETYEERKTFYKHYVIDGRLLKGTFDLGNGKFLTDTTLYLHTREEITNAIDNAGFKILDITRMGNAETSGDGLYLAIEGYKAKD
jgi:ubiquinone/menaquinone biosynthesis C-methylase UbiE